MNIFQSLRAKLLGFAFALFFITAPSVFAQTGSISGTVTDASGAVVTDANVIATNLGTNDTRTTITTGAGTYRFAGLTAGNYSVSISKTGFKTVNFASVTLTVDQPVTLDAKFETGAITATVEVTASAAPTIDTEDATLSNVIEHTQMTELPLILRDPYQLVLLGPGITQSDGMGGVSVNGGRERNNNFLLDGTDNNDADVPGNLGGVTAQNPDSTEEFRVLTNNFAPEYGRNNGAIIDVITRSGTNDFHGDLFYFGRWNALGARDYFNNNIDPVSGLVEPQNPYVRNLYGGSIGGPIKKDKTFFFLNYQGDRFVTVLTNSSIVPTAAFKSGIFNYTNPQTGASQTINLLANVPGEGQNGTGLPLDSTMQKILAFYPNPTIPNGDGATGTLFFPSESREKDEDATTKIDHKLNANNNLFVRYIYNYFGDPNPFHSDTLPGGLGAIPSTQKTQGVSVGLTTSFSPTLTNEARFGFNRLNLFFGCTGIPEFDSVGNVDSEGRGADYQLPVFASFGCPEPNNSPASGNRQGTYQTADNLTKVWRNHAIKFGGEFRDVYSNNYTDFVARQNFTFNAFSGYGVAPLNQATLNPGVDSQQLEDEVSSILGLVAGATQTQFFTSAGTRVANDELNFIQHETAGYVQDTWKILPNLSLTYGLRYEYYSVPVERSGTISNLFQDASGPAPFTFTPVGPGTGHQLYKDDYTNFEPRFGFAWDPFKDGRTSVRGGIGLFTDRIFGNLFEDQRSNPPFQPSFNNTPVANFGATAAAQLENQPLPPVLTPSPVVPNESFLFPGIFANNIKPPRVVTWNFGIQRQVTSSLTFDANYVGNHGTRILRVVDGAPPQPALVNQLLAMGIDPSVLQFNTLYAGAEQGVLPFDPVNNNAFLHAFDSQTSGHSWYDGLQIQVNERLYHGLQIGGSYTYAHALDDSSDSLFPTLNNTNFPVDSFNLRREKGNSGFDTRHRGVINFVYTPNIGRGKGHLSEGFVGRAFEGWEISGIAAWQTGLPYDIFGFLDTLHTGFADRVTVVDPSILHTAPANPNPGVPSAPVFTGFNPAAFNPQNGTIPINWGVPSPLGRNAWYGPGINNWNTVLAKNTAITERVSFQLRFEFYNLFNRVQFNKPDNILGDPNFMYSTSQAGQNDGTTGARQIQIGAKLRF